MKAGVMLLSMAVSLWVAQAQGQPSVLVVMPGSELRVLGTTNVNQFTCSAERYLGNDTLNYTAGEGVEDIRFAHGSIRVEVRAFDCRNPIMTSDFRHTLKMREHPQVEIRLRRIMGWPEALQMADGTCNRRAVMTELEIVVAGCVRRVELLCELSCLESGKLRLVGQGGFRFADFGLTPPERLFGAVWVAEAIDVAFDLHLRAVQ